VKVVGVSEDQGRKEPDDSVARLELGSWWGCKRLEMSCKSEFLKLEWLRESCVWAYVMLASHVMLATTVRVSQSPAVCRTVTWSLVNEQIPGPHTQPRTIAGGVSDLHHTGSDGSQACSWCRPSLVFTLGKHFLWCTDALHLCRS
jgi:hypothetical protein